MLGIDLGGTKIAAVVVDAEYHVVHRMWRIHGARGYIPCMNLVMSVLSECEQAAASSGQSISAVGIALAAFLSRDRTDVRDAANLGITGKRFAADLERAAGVPVAIENDAQAAALAEARRGAGRHVSVLLMLTLGTGVGGGIVIDGNVMRGWDGLAAHIGHLPIADGPRCVCGGTGCLETVASGPAIARRARESMAKGQAPGLSTNAGRSVAEMTSEQVVAAAHAGDPVARGILTEAGSAVGTAIAQCVPIIDPAVATIGGSLAYAASGLILGPARAMLKRRLTIRHIRSAIPVVLARCGPEAGALGAAELARDRVDHTAP